MNKLKIILFYYLFSRLRVWKYKLLSLDDCLEGKPRLWQPLLSRGKGKICFENNTTVGVRFSPSFFSSYAYFEARKISAKIIIEENVSINNNAAIICERETITIGKNTLIGLNFQASDSDFHNLDPLLRIEGQPDTAAVYIGSNVFIGSNVIVLKGVEIGDNTVIANGSIVTKSIPANVIAAGIPCKIIRPL
jgi:galactoside O-acetyltransferase